MIQCSKCCSAKLPSRVGLIHTTQTHQVFMYLRCAYEPRPYIQHRLIRYSCIFAARMSPTLNGSLALRCFKYGNAVQLCNGIMFDFHSGLPHVHVQLIALIPSPLPFSSPLSPSLFLSSGPLSFPPLPSSLPLLLPSPGDSLMPRLLYSEWFRGMLACSMT